MIREPCFAALPSSIKHSIGINIKEIIIVSSGIHRYHSILTLLGGNNLTEILKDKRVGLKISQGAQSKPAILSLVVKPLQD